MTQYLAQNLKLPWMEGSPPSVIEGPLGPGAVSAGAVVVSAMKLVFLIGGIGLLLMLLAGGFAFLTSAGDTKKLDKGRQQITNAILGFIIIFASYWMVQILGYVFGFDAIKQIFT